MTHFPKLIHQAIWLSLIIIALGLSACGPNASQTAFPHDNSDLRPDERVEYGQLENGLRFAVMSNDTPSNTASLLMRLDVGSIHEQDDERGLAHFLEHMAFNGSENIPEGELIPRLEKYGLAFGPDTNASTDFDETIYQLELPEVNDEILDETLMIMREIADRLTLTPEAIARERDVILAEKRARESPGVNAFLDQFSFYLEGSLFPDRFPIGTEDTIRSVTAEQFVNFYRSYYRPESTFIVLVGDFETDYAAEKIAAHFADWNNSYPKRETVTLKPLRPEGVKVGYYSHPEIETSLTLNVMRPPDITADTGESRQDTFIQGLGNRILSRRLARMAEQIDSPFIFASASHTNFYDIRNINQVSLASEPEKWEIALAAGEQALRRAYLYGFTQAELNEQLANSRSALETAVQISGTDRTSNLAQTIMSLFAADSVMTSAKDDLTQFEAYADTITPKQVHDAFIENWTGYETPQIYLSTPLEIDQAEMRVLAAFTQSQEVEVTPIINEAPTEFAYSDFGPSGEVVERGRIDDIGIETIRFANNVRLNIKPTKYEQNVARIRVIFGRGELSLPAHRPGLRWFAPNMLNLGGLAVHTEDELRTLTAGKTIGASFSLGSQHLYLSGASTVDELREQLNLMTAYVTDPGYREEARSRYNKYITSFYPTLDSTPGGVASRDIDRIIRSGDPRFGIPTEEELITTDLSDLKNWMDMFLSDSAIEISVVGDVDIETVIDEVARTFGALPERKPNLWVAPDDVRNLTFPEGQNRPIILTHAGEPNTSLLRIYWPAPDGQDVDTVRKLNVLSSVLELKLTDILREDSGVSYSPSGFNFAPRTYPNYGYLGVSVEVSPEDIDNVAAKIRAIASDLRNGAIDMDVFERAIRPIRENVESSLETNSYWLGLIERAQSDPDALERHRSRVQTYEAVTLADIADMASTQFAPDQSLTIYILPED